MQTKEKVVKKVAEIYDWIDHEIQKQNYHCKNCGKCCDFEIFDHRLFITTPELIYLTEKLYPDKVRPMADSICPYNEESNCTIHANRFAGCRIFFCTGDKDFQSRLTEEALKKFKSICIEYKVPYRYIAL